MVDEFHLEILRGNDLMGRWYLADVEVVRDIAERFKLFLGPDEMEFLADDALTFAYEGVTRMQQGWVNAQKRKRRHRRAAADSARRKDTEGAEPEAEPEQKKIREPEEERAPRPVPVAPTSELAKKLAAIAAAEAAASEPVASGRRLTWAEVEAQEADTVEIVSESAPARAPARVSKLQKTEPAATTSRKLRTRRNEEPETLPKPVPLPQSAPVPITEHEHLPEPIAVAFEPPVSYAPVPVIEEPVVEIWSEPTPPQREKPTWTEPEPTWPEMPAWTEPSWIEPEQTEPSWIAPQPQPSSKVADPVVGSPEPTPVPEPVPVVEVTADEQPDDLTTRRQRRRGRKESVPEPEAVEVAPPREVTDLASAREAIEAKAIKEAKGSGHHPAETNVGLLAKLRRPAKASEEHEHAYQESRSIGGLTRRVCVECSHVSIVSDE